MGKSLMGKADSDGDGRLTIQEWVEYIESKGEQSTKTLQLYENVLTNRLNEHSASEPKSLKAEAERVPSVNEKAKSGDPVTSSQYYAPGAVRFEGDSDGGFARAYECEPSGPMDMQYPMHCMKMADFLELKTLDPHNGLVERGLVVPMERGLL